MGLLKGRTKRSDNSDDQWALDSPGPGASEADAKSSPDDPYAFPSDIFAPYTPVARRRSFPWLFVGLAGGTVVIAVALFVLLRGPLSGRSAVVAPEPKLAPTSQPIQTAHEGQVSAPTATPPSSPTSSQASAQNPVSGSLATRYTYDPNGNLKTRTDANGALTTYEYDALNRLTAIRYSDQSSVTYTYDAAGRRTSMTDSLGRSSYEYDIHDRLVSVTDPNGNTLQYAYDPRGLLTRLVYPDGVAASYTWNEDGRLSTIQDQTGITRYQYDQGGRPTARTLPNGVTSNYEYDAAGRLVSIEHRGPDGGLLMDFRYEYNAVNNRTQVTRTEANAALQVTRYEYDALDRLTRVSYPDGEVVSYQYDAVGNRTLQQSSVNGDTQYMHNGAGQLVWAEGPNGVLTYRYDANGNLVERQDGAGHIVQYGWDYENRLAKVISGTATVEFRYDGDGRRLAKIANGNQTTYVQHGSLLPQVVVAQTGHQATRVLLGSQHVGESDAEGVRYYLEDALGSVAGAVDAAGRLLETVEYDAFGRGRASALAVLFGFAGEQADAETGLVFLRARYYDDDTGAFISQDPFSYSAVNSQALNRYAYVTNNPVNLIDPLGLAGRSSNDPPTNISTDSTNAQIVTRPLGGWMTWTGIGAYLFFNFGIGHTDVRVGNTTVGFFPNGWAANPGNDYPTWMSFTQNVNLPAGNKEALLPQIQYNFCSYNCQSAAAEVVQRLGGQVSGLYLPGKSLNDVVTTVGSALSSVGEATVGGVSLDRAASVLGDLNDITGATFDPATGQVVLIGRKDTLLPPMDPDDLAVAIRAVYSGADPGVTMVPVDPTMRDITQRVEYFGRTQNTRFGLVMFEADRYLKSLAGGQDTLTLQPLSPNVPGFKSEIDLMLDLGVGKVPWHRNWFVPGEVVLKRSADGQSMIFDRATIKLESRFIKFDADGNPQDVPGSSPVTDQFTRSVTHHYAELAAGKPELAELVRLAKIVGVVKWLHDTDIPVDLGWLSDYRIKQLETPLKTPGLVATKSAADGSYRITSMGGVGYDTPNTYDVDSDGRAAALGIAVLAARPAEMPITWDFEQGGERLTAVALNLAPSEIIGGDSVERTDALVRAAGGQTIDFTRRSNSLAQATGPLGRGWLQTVHSLAFRRVAVPGNPEAFHTQAILTYGSDRIEYNLTSDGLFRPGDLTSAYLAVGLTGVDRFEPLATPALTMAPGLPGEPLDVRDGSERPVQYTGFVVVRRDGSRLAFDPSGRLDAIRDSAKNQVNYIYQADRLVAVRDAEGRGIELAYDAAGKLTGLSTSDARAVRYVYDALGNLAGVFDETGEQLEGYAYDSDGRLSQITESAGRTVLKNNYDGLGRLIATESAQGGSVRVHYDAVANTATYTNWSGSTYTRRYNKRKRLAAETGFDGATTTYEYDTQDHLTALTDPNGNTTGFKYDSRGLLTEVVLPLGGRIRWLNNNDFGVPELIVDSLGRMTLRTVDAQGRVVAETSGLQMENESPDGGFTYFEVDTATSAYQYDSAGHLSTIKDPGGSVTRFSYDAIGNLTEVHLPGGGKITQAFDARSQPVTITDASGVKTEFEYDAQGRLISLTTPAGVVRYGYTDGDLTSYTDALGRTSQYAYHPAGQLARVVDPVGGVTALDFDPAGRLTSIKDAKGRSTAYSYGADNRLIGETMATGVPADVAAPATLPALADEVAGLIISQPGDAAAIRQQLTGLDTAQLESLRELSGRGRLLGQLLDQAELDFLQGAGARMLTEARPLELQVYGLGERKLVVYVENTAGAQGRVDALEKVRRHYWLQHEVSDQVVVSLVTSGTSLKVLAGDRFSEITPRELETFGGRLARILAFLPPLRTRATLSAGELAQRYPRRLGQLLLAKDLVPAGVAVIGFDGDLRDLNFQQVFPDARVYRTQGTDVEAILRRRQRLNEMKVSLADIALLNGIPATEEEVQKVGKSTKDTARWLAIHNKWRAMVEKRGITAASASADALLAALESNPLVVVLVAHSNGYAILLPDGSEFDIKSLSPEVRQAIARNAPVVWLFSCRTGSIQDGQSLAQGLLDLGATSVIAPVSDIKAEESAVVLERFLDAISKGKPLMEALDDALKSAMGNMQENRLGRAPSPGIVEAVAFRPSPQRLEIS